MYIEKAPTPLSHAEHEERARHHRSLVFHKGLVWIARIFQLGRKR